MKAAVRAHLAAALGAVPVDWGWAAQGAAVPRVVLTIVSGETDLTHSGPSGLRRNRVQVDCYAASYAPADDLAREVRAALSGWHDGAIRGVFLSGERDLSPDTGAGEFLARVSLDFMVHHNEG